MLNKNAFSFVDCELKSNFSLLKVHRLVVVDENDKVIGIISLSDLLMYLVLRPTGECAAGGTSLRNEHSSIEEKDETTAPEGATGSDGEAEGDSAEGSQAEGGQDEAAALISADDTEQKNTVDSECQDP